MPENLYIAIDGTSASGKGTLAKMLAKHYNISHLDTGAMYRIFAQQILDRGIRLNNAKEIIDLAKKFKYSTSLVKQPGEEVAHAASVAAQIPEVRKIFTNWQKNFANSNNGAVLDGRDIGSVVLKDAKHKFYIIADLSVRAKRRYDELRSRNIDCDLTTIAEQLKKRDEKDQARTESPLVIAPNSIIIDTSSLTPQDAFEIAVNNINNKTNN